MEAREKMFRVSCQISAEGASNIGEPLSLHHSPRCCQNSPRVLALLLKLHSSFYVQSLLEDSTDLKDDSCTRGLCKTGRGHLTRHLNTSSAASRWLEFDPQQQTLFWSLRTPSSDDTPTAHLPTCLPSPISRSVCRLSTVPLASPSGPSSLPPGRRCLATRPRSSNSSPARPSCRRTKRRSLRSLHTTPSFWEAVSS